VSREYKNKDNKDNKDKNKNKNKNKNIQAIEKPNRDLIIL